MTKWKFSLILALIVSIVASLIAIPFLTAIGIAFIYFLYLVLPLISFSSALIISHRKGWNFYYPIFLPIFCALTDLLLSQVLHHIYGLFDYVDYELPLLIAILTFVPAIVGSLVGGLMHQKGWIRHPSLPILICLTIYFLALFTNNAYPYDLQAEAPLLLYGANSGIFAIIGLAVGYWDKKGYLVPIILSLFFQIFFGFMHGDWLSYFTLIYLLVAYLFLFLGRFWQNSRADKRSQVN